MDKDKPQKQEVRMAPSEVPLSSKPTKLVRVSQPSSAVPSLKRKPSRLIKLDRSKSIHHIRQKVREGVPQDKLPKPNRLMNSDGKCQRVWEYAARILTCYIPDIFITKVLKKPDPSVAWAWREKMALCTISFLMCTFLCFFTFFFQSTSCPPPNGSKIKFSDVKSGAVQQSYMIVNGGVYDFGSYLATQHPSVTKNMKNLYEGFGAPKDLSPLFKIPTPTCDALGYKIAKTCDYAQMYPAMFSGQSIKHCHSYPNSQINSNRIGQVYYQWNDVYNTSYQLLAFNGVVLDMAPYFASGQMIFGEQVDNLIKRSLRSDGTAYLAKDPDMLQVALCMKEAYLAGDLEIDPYACIAANTILNIALIMICSLVMARFFLATFFGWFLSWQLGKIQATRTLLQIAKGEESSQQWDKMVGQGVTAATHPQSFSLFHRIDFKPRYKELYTLCLVTAYSEGYDGLFATIESLATTDYHDNYKMIFVVADGVVQGAGNDKPTGDIILDMMELDPAIHGSKEYEIIPPKKEGDKETKRLKCLNAEPQSYAAIGSGPKGHNMARIYCGTFKAGKRRVAMILISKCGAPAEWNAAKAGNRGKRDSQIVLMDFLSKITFNDPLSPMQFDLFTKWSHIMTVQNGGIVKVTPDLFEIVLMVDADTKVMPDSLTRMVSVMQRDPAVMGLCGETRLTNKLESFTTAIQVFEYFISHHLAKTFESIFGQVSCLPGCFCMYRIKAPKPLEKSERQAHYELGDADQICDWIPIISNPDIVADYSECVVNTLHKKNLLLLGEDRYLSTLMLRTFPQRKMMFVPRAMCKTQVPAEFKVLLSQRRRWINSTIHNLMELVLVRELCGTFCFSMQFVVFLELVGTVTLPAAIIFTMVLIINSAVGEPQWVPLGLLGAILGLPAILIMLTTRKVVYIWYMLIYLLALPIWNFVLPTYAFWHFDDFSWGQTRMVAGEAKDAGHHGSDSVVEPVKEVIPTKPWAEWEVQRRKALQGKPDPVGQVTVRGEELEKFSQSKRKSRIQMLFQRNQPEDQTQKSASLAKPENPGKLQISNGAVAPAQPQSASLQQNTPGVSSALKSPEARARRQ